jgi:hypothetical protein
MLQAYLRSRGMPLTSQNMQRVLTENARGSSDIPGLVNDVPSTDPGTGQSGNVAGKIEKAPTRGLPVPPMPPPNATNTTDNTQPQSGSGGGMDLSNLGALIAAGGGAGLGMWAGSRGRNPAPGDTVPPPVDPGTGVPAVRPDTDVAMGNRFDVLPPEQRSPMQIAMDRAVQPQIGGPQPQLQIAGPQAQPALPAPAQGQSGDAIPLPNQSAIPLPDQSPLPRPPMPDRTVPQGMVRYPDGSIGTPGGGFGGARIGRVTPKPYIPRLMLR